MFLRKRRTEEVVVLGWEGEGANLGREKHRGRGFTFVRDGHLGGFSALSLKAALPFILGEQI